MNRGPIWIYCIMYIGCIAAILYSPSNPPVRATRVLVTAAHMGEIEGYTQVYAEEASDYALYLRDDYTATPPPIGARVTLAETAATVATTTPTEFTVTVKNISKIVPGVSGSPVYYNDLPIGFISGWNGDGTLRCIFY